MSYYRCVWVGLLNIITLILIVWIFISISVWIPFFGWTVVAIILMVFLLVIFIVTLVWVLRCTRIEIPDTKTPERIDPSSTGGGVSGDKS